MPRQFPIMSEKAALTFSAATSHSLPATRQRWERPQYLAGLWRAIDEPQFDDSDYITSVTL